MWNTHGRITNAMVVGVIPRLRYVLLSDRLVEELTPEEVEAVFGHEVGHVKHHHILFYVGFFLVSVLVVFGIWNVATSRVPAIAQYFPATEDWAQLPFVGLAFAYIFVVFGFLSRRCERQADVFGCRAVSCAARTASLTSATPCCCRRERGSVRRGSAPSSTLWRRLRNSTKSAATGRDGFNPGSTPRSPIESIFCSACCPIRA